MVPGTLRNSSCGLKKKKKKKHLLKLVHDTNMKKYVALNLSHPRERENNIKIKKPRKPEQPQTLKAPVGKHRGLGARICPQRDETRASKENKFLKIQPNGDVAPNSFMCNIEICKRSVPVMLMPKEICYFRSIKI